MKKVFAYTIHPFIHPAWCAWWVLLDPGFILVKGGVAAILLSVEFNAKFREKSLNFGDSNTPFLGALIEF
jgi:hypothetical protein